MTVTDITVRPDSLQMGFYYSEAIQADIAERAAIDKLRETMYIKLALAGYMPPISYKTKDAGEEVTLPGSLLPFDLSKYPQPLTPREQALLRANSDSTPADTRASEKRARIIGDLRNSIRVAIPGGSLSFLNHPTLS